MTNELTRAWEMLTPEQRPVGMVMATGNDGTSMFGDYQEERGHIKMSDAAAQRGESYDMFRADESQRVRDTIYRWDTGRLPPGYAGGP
jgi:hypothetical protein